MQKNGFEQTICVILSGGISSRMKTHKALLPFSDNKSFLQHIIEVYQKAGISMIYVVKNHEIDLGEFNNGAHMPGVIENRYPEKGRLFSLQLGLKAAPGVSYCFIQNIDNPFVTVKLIQNLFAVRTEAAFISPEYESRGGHPVLISELVINRIKGLTDYKGTLREILDEFSRYKLTTDDEQCIRNINTPEDYEAYFGNLKTTAFS